jgi:RNA polymerase sigma-70 factor (ECF subfamily)
VPNLSEAGNVHGQALQSPPDESLVERCLDGDAPAWRALYESNWTFVSRVARRMGTPQEELDDVCQEVFVVAFRKLRQFQSGRLTTWLYRITANVASDRHRRRRLRRALSDLWGHREVEPVSLPDRTVESREAEALVSRVLERMSAKKREVFVLYEIEGLEGEAIAELVGAPVNTVWTRLHHARKDFERMARRELEP